MDTTTPARDRLIDALSFTECANQGATPDELIDAAIAEALHEAARTLEATGRDDDSIALLDLLASMTAAVPSAPEA